MKADRQWKYQGSSRGRKQKTKKSEENRWGAKTSGRKKKGRVKTYAKKRAVTTNRSGNGMAKMGESRRKVLVETARKVSKHSSEVVSWLKRFSSEWVTVRM